MGGGSSVATLSIPQPRPVMVPNAACCSFWFRRVRTPVVRLRHRRDMAAGVSKLGRRDFIVSHIPEQATPRSRCDKGK